jgi:protein SCO1
MRSMVRISNHFKGYDNIVFLCFSVDYRKDSVARLKNYFDKLSVKNPNFHLLQIAEKDEIKRIAEAYMSIALEDPTAPGGIDHSGWLLLADQNFYLRSYCLGTDDNEVDRFIDDIEFLLHEK